MARWMLNIPFTPHLILWDREFNLQQRSLLVLLSVYRLGSNFKLHVGGRSQGGRGHVTRPCTHISLGNLLPLAGILQGADTEVGDGDSGTGSQGDQHEEGPQAAVQRQLQAVVLLQREAWNIHFTPGDISGDGGKQGKQGLFQSHCKTPEPAPPHFTQSSSVPNFTVWARVIDGEGCQSPLAQGTL